MVVWKGRGILEQPNGRDFLDCQSRWPDPTLPRIFIARYVCTPGATLSLGGHPRSLAES